MGIVNVTPDSFSDGGRHDDVRTAIAHCERLVAEGADILDIGGESTRPGAAPVPPGEEIRRVLPVVRELARAAPVSIDTRNAATMEAALEAGAEIVNDISALRHDGAAFRTLARHQAPVVLMHMLGTDPRTMQKDPRYGDVALDVARFLRDRVEVAERLGIPRGRIAVDPGIGFGKTPAHNLVVLANLAALQVLGRPILLGASRKSTIGKVLDLPADQRVEGTLATTVIGVAAKVDIVRVHDVKENLRAARMSDAVLRG